MWAQLIKKSSQTFYSDLVKRSAWRELYRASMFLQHYTHLVYAKKHYSNALYEYFIKHNVWENNSEVHIEDI